MKLCLSAKLQGALTFVEVLVALAALVALVTLLALPSMLKTRSSLRGIGCMNNLKQVSLAFHIWAQDNNDYGPTKIPSTNGGTMEWVTGGVVWPHFLVMSNELNTPKVLNCMADVARPVATNWATLTDSNISYFIGVDASLKHPTMLLAGDRRITRDGTDLPLGLQMLDASQRLGWSEQHHAHNAFIQFRVGHLALADESVHRVDARGLLSLLKQSGAATNRLAMP